MIPQKKKLIEKYIKVADLPKAYHKNSEKESKLLEYVEDFRRQFIALFPQRRTPFLYPLNECGRRVSNTMYMHSDT